MNIKKLLGKLHPGENESRSGSSRSPKKKNPAGEYAIYLPGESSSGPAASATPPSAQTDTADTPPDSSLDVSLPAQRPDGRPERRHCFRVRYDGLLCRIKELQKTVRVHDISATGLGLRHTGKRIKAGTRLHLVLGIEGKALLKGVILRVVRHEQGILGGAFEELDRHQEAAVAQLVLDAQKQQRRKKASASPATHP